MEIGEKEFFELIEELAAYKKMVKIVTKLSQKVLEQNSEFLDDFARVKQENEELKAIIDELMESEEDSFFGEGSTEEEECDCTYCKLGKEIAEKIAQELKEDAPKHVKIYSLSDLF